MNDDPSDTPRVVWTPLAKRKLHPTRAMASWWKAPRFNRAKAWATITESVAVTEPQWSLGAARATAECARLTRDVAALLACPAPPARLDARDADLAAALAARVERMTGGELYGRHEEVVGWWVDAGGVATALAAFGAAIRLERRELIGRERESWLVRHPGEHATSVLDAASLAYHLRRHLAVAPAAAWAEARDVAGALRAGASLGLRSLLAYMFPEEPAWALADARAWIDRARGGVEHGRRGAIWLLASLRDVTTAEAFAGEVLAGSLWHPHMSVEHIWNLPDTLGPDAARVLVPRLDELTRERRHAPFARGYAQALACIESPEAAAAFARHASHKTVGPVAEEYFARAPHLRPAG